MPWLPPGALGPLFSLWCSGKAPKADLAIKTGTSAALLTLVLSYRAAPLKKLQATVRAEWGVGKDRLQSPPTTAPTPPDTSAAHCPKYTRAGKSHTAKHSGHAYSSSRLHSLFFLLKDVITPLSAWAALWGFSSFQHSCAPGFDAAVHAAGPSHSLAFSNVTFKCVFIFKLTSSRPYGIKGGPAKKLCYFLFIR